MLKNIFFGPQYIAERIMPLPNWALISITGPKEKPAKTQDSWQKLLRLAFDDIQRTYAGWKCFSYAQAADIIMFLHNITFKCPETETLIVHCEVGVSRSAAIALFARDRYAPDVLLNGYQNYNKLVFDMLEYEYKKVQREEAKPQEVIDLWGKK